MSTKVETHNEKAQAVWNSAGGRYDAISRTIADAIEHAVERLDPRPGERILDVATGTGWASRLVARRGAQVVGADIAEAMLATARELAAREELPITYEHGDAERLPFPDAAFDAAVSTFGVMFASKPERAAAELARVVKKGGRVTLATWTDDGNVAAMFGVMKRHMGAPPAGAPPSPFAWGRRERLVELLGADFELAFEDGTNTFRYPSGARAYDLWVNHYGPTKSLAARLDDGGRDALRKDLVEWHETFPSPLGFTQPRTYVVTRGIRR
jgi:SAM-dependent methyltransferase